MMWVRLSLVVTGLVQFFCSSSSMQASSTKTVLVLFSDCVVLSSLSEDVVDEDTEDDADVDEDDVVLVVVGSSPCGRLVISTTPSVALMSLVSLSVISTTLSVVSMSVEVSLLSVTALAAARCRLRDVLMILCTTMLSVRSSNSSAANWLFVGRLGVTTVGVISRC